MKYFTTLLLVVTITLTANAQTEIKKEYFKNGKIKSETPYVDGKITGVKKEYYKNGILESEKPVINGEANGTLKWYFESGVLRLVADYVNNKRNGVQKWYYESGNIQSEAIFKDGEMMSINTFADVKPAAKKAIPNNDIAVSAPIAQPNTQKVSTPIHNDNNPTTKNVVANNNAAVSTPIVNQNNGCVSGDCEKGFGTYKWPNGETYTGDFKNSKRDGIGTYTNLKGEVFAGAWKNNEWFESSCLTGDCKDGFGTYVFKYYSSLPGTTYIGQFKNGREHGEGISIEKNGTTFKGNWKNGHRDGEGTETNPDGINLTGKWDHSYLKGKGIETLPNGYYKTGKFKYSNCCPDKSKFYTKENVEISYSEYNTLKNDFSIKANAEKALAAQPKCISGNCQNGYGVIQYNDGNKYFGMYKNGTYEGFGYIVSPDETKYEYESLYSLKKVAVTTPGKVSYGEWKNGVKTRSFNSMEEFSGVVYRELNSEYTHFMDYFFNTNMANSQAERKRIDKENEAAYGRELNKKMENVSMTPSSSSNEKTIKTTTITKSGNEIIDFKTVPKKNN